MAAGVGGLDGEPCAGLFLPACVTGVEVGRGGVDGVKGGTQNGGAIGVNTSLFLPHYFLVVSHAHGGAFDESIGENCGAGRGCLVADIYVLGGIDNPNASLLDGEGKEEKKWGVR